MSKEIQLSSESVQKLAELADSWGVDLGEALERAVEIVYCIM